MEKPDLLLSFLTNRSIYSRWNWGICGRAELCFVVRIFFPSLFFFFLFPSTLVRDSRQKAWQRPGLLHQLRQKMGLNREQSKALFQHCRVGKVGQGRKCRFDRTGN